MTTFLAIILLALLLWLIPLYYQRWRRSYLRARPLSDEQRQLVIDSLPLYRHLSAAQQQELNRNIALFLRDKEFVGCDGLQVTEAMRVAVASFACLLLLGRENDCYPSLYTVLLYPETYVARETHVKNYVESERHSVREGEAHYRGPVVLSWSDLAKDMREPQRGHNVALHEFAHKLDEEDGYYDGRPLFDKAGEGKNWAGVLGPEFERLQQRRAHPADRVKNPGVLDLYGAESPAEFFAVATEAFFVIPAKMKSSHPQLYEEFRAFYRLDPDALQRENPPGDRYPT